MAADFLLIGAAAASVAGVAVLRLAWARPRRSMRLNGVGWAAILLGCVLAALHSGAWGISLAAMTSMAAALLCLGQAGLAAPAGAGRASNRRVRMLPEADEPLQLGRRTVTFLLVSVAAALISTGIAVGSRALALIAGVGEADANVLALAAMPLAWTILSYALLMENTRRAQIKMLLIWAALAAIGLILEVIG